MKTKGKAWQLVLTVLLIAAFVYTAFFGVAVKYGDVTTTYIKGAKDIRFGVDIKGGVNVTFVPSDGYDATDDQLEAAQLVIENRLVALNVTDYELYVDNNSDSLILEFPWQSGETEFDPEGGHKVCHSGDRHHRLSDLPRGEQCRRRARPRWLDGGERSCPVRPRQRQQLRVLCGAQVYR